MKLEIDGINFNIILDESFFIGEKIPVVFLHGFTGYAKDWLFIFDSLPQNYFPIAIDLVGHGGTDSPDNISCYSCGNIVYHLNSIIGKLGIDQFVIAGYSMGGRAVLSYSIKYPHKIIAAILESSTAGIDDIEEKKERVQYDLLLSDKIREEGVERFMDFWLELPMFQSLKEKFDVELIKNERAKNNCIGLSNSLAAFSTGLMNSYWEELKYIEFPVLLITGSDDQKFTTINRHMSEAIKNVNHKIIENAGHNTHLEKPGLFTKLVSDFLISVKG
jgi:2-succinyl-6-hydroxy-2,4-cyclohexadiene-1-carboxylate synthase